jgi:hypothetical protein
MNPFAKKAPAKGAMPPKGSPFAKGAAAGKKAPPPFAKGKKPGK